MVDLVTVTDAVATDSVCDDGNSDCVGIFTATVKVVTGTVSVTVIGSNSDSDKNDSTMDFG